MSDQDADGYSQFGFSEAIYDALHTTYADVAKPRTRFKITDQWVEVEEHHSPWHITYKVKVEQAGS
jgi:hypothetical protein